jgi:hypothetical protein
MRHWSVGVQGLGSGGGGWWWWCCESPTAGSIYGIIVEFVVVSESYLGARRSDHLFITGLCDRAVL